MIRRRNLGYAADRVVRHGEAEKLRVCVWQGCVALATSYVAVDGIHGAQSVEAILAVVFGDRCAAAERGATVSQNKVAEKIVGVVDRQRPAQ